MEFLEKGLDDIVEASPLFLIATGKKPNAKGYVNCYFRGIPEDDYEVSSDDTDESDEEEAEDEEAELPWFAEDDHVSFDNGEEETMDGVVLSLDSEEKTAEIETEDGDVWVVSWDAVEESVEEDTEESEDDESEEDEEDDTEVEEVIPEKGDVYTYAGKDVKILSVNKSKQTVVAASVKTGKKLAKPIPFDKLMIEV